MSINSSFSNFIKDSPTAYHSVHQAESMLKREGFKQLSFTSVWSLSEGGKYYMTVDGSALIAFIYTEKNKSFNIVAAHSDSPALKLKYNPEMGCEGYWRLNVESYGGGLLYSWLDRKLKIAGRAVFFNKEKQTLFTALVNSEKSITIPSVAIHMNREANKGFAINQQVDMLPLVAQGDKIDTVKTFLPNEYAAHELYDYDLFVACNEEPFYSGVNDEFFTAPRLDDLCGVYAGLTALLSASPKCVPLLFVADNEEVGSSTKQGAGGTMLLECLKRINSAWGRRYCELGIALGDSFMVSMDNAHSLHPNHPEKNDPTNKPLMNKGIVIKHHANQNYTTDALSSSVFKHILKSKNISYQDFFMRSDMPCGGTLGAISSSQVSIRSIDIGLAQLAMHSSMETIGAKDMDTLFSALNAFFNAGFANTLSTEIKVTI